MDLVVQSTSSEGGAVIAFLHCVYNVSKCEVFRETFNPISLRGVSRKHTSYIIDSHVKMSENGRNDLLSFISFN